MKKILSFVLNRAKEPSKKILSFVLNRAKEPSSWRGAVMLATGFGVGVNPELVTHIIAAGTGLAGLIGVLAPDVKKGE